MNYIPSPSLIIVTTRKQLNNLINNIPIDDSGSYIYINLSSDNFRFLELKGFKEVTNSEMNFDSKSKFLQEYIDLIGQLNLINNNKFWYASYIAAKNRFATDLSTIIEQYIFSISIIKEKDFDYFIIINPHWSLINKLGDIANKKDINFICFEKNYRRWIYLKISRLRKFISLLIEMIKLYKRVLLSRVILNNNIKKELKKKKNYYLLKTFIYEYAFGIDNEYEDAYFGKLISYIKSKKNLIILGHIPNNYHNCLNRIKEQNNYTIIPFEYFISFIDIIRSIKEILLYKGYSKNHISFFDYNVSEVIQMEIDRSRSAISLEQYIYYVSIKNLTNIITIDRFVYTYENNPWEKMCIMALRKYSANTEIVGYQHSTISQATANFFISKHEVGIIPLPDKVLTAGLVPKKIMEKYGAYKSRFLEISCGLRFEYLFNNVYIEKKYQGNILLVPDYAITCLGMINWVIKQLMAHPKYQLTIRMHPYLPFDSIEKYLDYNVNTIKNITISKDKPLLDDLRMTDIIIYKGSTVSLEALCLGIPAIHFDEGSFLSEDPLFQSDSLKWTVSKSSKLTNVIDSINNLDSVSKSIQMKKARKYIYNYFYPVSENNLQKFL